MVVSVGHLRLLTERGCNTKVRPLNYEATQANGHARHPRNQPFLLGVRLVISPANEIAVVAHPVLNQGQCGDSPLLRDRDRLEKRGSARRLINPSASQALPNFQGPLVHTYNPSSVGSVIPRPTVALTGHHPFARMLKRFDQHRGVVETTEMTKPNAFWLSINMQSKLDVPIRISKGPVCTVHKPGMDPQVPIRNLAQRSFLGTRKVRIRVHQTGDSTPPEMRPDLAHHCTVKIRAGTGNQRISGHVGKRLCRCSVLDQLLPGKPT